MKRLIKKIINYIKYNLGLWNTSAGEFLIKDLQKLSGKDKNEELSKMFYILSLPYDHNKDKKLYLKYLRFYLGVLEKYGIYISWDCNPEQIYKLIKKEYDNKNFYKVC